MLLAALMVPAGFLQRLAYPLYGVCLLLLVGVLFFGIVSNGARRWIDLGFVNLQPAEPMKLGLILALARLLPRFMPPPGGYRLWQLSLPLALVLAPMALIAKQPDLGSALVLGAIGVSMVLFVGINWRALLVLGLAAALVIPSAWHFLHDYQKRRVLVLLNPEADPLGSGYHIIQSKIAVGSGGFLGKGFLKGTQSQLEFLPEHTTDFVFSVLAEEWGFSGAVIVLALYALLLYRLVRVVTRSRELGDTLLVFGIAAMLFFHTVINVGMVVGVFPVVGIPLPLFSYGGSSVLSMMCALGLVLGVSMRRFMFVGRG